MLKHFIPALVLVLLCCRLSAQTRPFEPYSTPLPGSTVSFSMQPIPAGKFMMGSPDSEPGHQTDEAPRRQVQVSAFWMGAKEVTFDEFQLFFSDDSLSRNSDVDAVTRPTPQYIDFSLGMGKQGGFPVSSLSQHAALMYCRWLYLKTGTFYRLPTEAEWEYACRAGSDAAYPHGNDSAKLDDYAWTEHNSSNKYHKTGERKANAWGLYDMLGNVEEWTSDQYQDNFLKNLTDNATDPVSEPTTRYPKTVKGGAYNTPRSLTRSGARFHSDKSWNRRDPQIPKSKWWMTDAANVGFRIVAPVKQPSPADAEAYYQKYLNN